MNKIKLSCSKCGEEEVVVGREADWLRKLLEDPCPGCGSHDTSLLCSKCKAELEVIDYEKH